MTKTLLITVLLVSIAVMFAACSSDGGDTETAPRSGAYHGSGGTSNAAHHGSGGARSSADKSSGGTRSVFRGRRGHRSQRIHD